ncbi:MAG: carbohydrate ABC transporter permease [Alicyclobacillus herbarius]|uniref:carbohydrate ABC transporter permease n=1 Tax=Alicyclobacillus herbarius TaxID=122960 RepID=UPI0023527380|nr:carbohydrate ABC transporter permease [Alicyclobacillus herbarius]MCL6632851.1 carbohydrate ABC transporter permease [Alicyclobacillus herbarius]
MTLRRINRMILYLVLCIFAAGYLLPVYVALITSLKPNNEVDLSRMWQLPSHLDFASWGQAFQKLSPGLTTSLELAIPATVIVAIVGACNGYALSKWQFRGSHTLFQLLLFGMFIPYQSVLIPLLKVMDALGLYNSVAGLVLVHVIYGLPIATLIFRNFYVGIPNDLVEAARIDGNGYWGIFWNIILPLSIPGFVVIGIWEFTQVWNEFLFAATLTTPPHQPVMVALQNLSGSQIVQWNVQMAGAIMAALPTLIVYIFLGKYFVRGLLAGSVKG